jgi:hypothetical protein
VTEGMATWLAFLISLALNLVSNIGEELEQIMQSLMFSNIIMDPTKRTS